MPPDRPPTDRSRIATLALTAHLQGNDMIPYHRIASITVALLLAAGCSSEAELALREAQQENRSALAAWQAAEQACAEADYKAEELNLEVVTLEAEVDSTSQLASLAAATGGPASMYYKKEYSDRGQLTKLRSNLNSAKDNKNSTCNVRDVALSRKNKAELNVSALLSNQGL